MIDGLFGEEFEIKVKQPNIKELTKKISDQKEEKEIDVNKILKSKKITLDEQLKIIEENVYKTLGKQKEKIAIIRDRQSFHDYITKAIEAKVIAIDTETNNSLDPVTCQIAGLCLYVPGEKQVYIPINHRDKDTKVRLANQCTEQDIKEELQRILNAKIEIVMHNGKFDYEVIKCTCGIAVPPTWDTIVCARLLNENELAGLKAQYTAKIDPEQEKYSIDKLFENVLYEDVDPELFAYYAAHDSGMTYELYLIQKEELSKEEYGPHLDLTGTQEIKGLRWLFHEVEMPIVEITAEMELTGVDVDVDFGEKLKQKFNAQLEDCDAKIAAEVAKIESIINNWLLSAEANAKTKSYVAKKTKMTQDKIEKMYQEIDKDGNRFKYGKAKAEQLEDPIKMSSPIQLAILLYDILEAPAPKDSRATGEEELTNIRNKIDADLSLHKDYSQEKLTKLTVIKELCDLILKRRGIMKLLTTYVEVIPDLAKHWPDNRIRFHLNANGTDTGRYSSGGRIKYNQDDELVEVSGINIQNIPSHGEGAICRALFRGAINNHQVEINNNYYEVPETDEVETTEGWKQVEELKIGDIILGENNQDKIINIIKQERKYLLYV